MSVALLAFVACGGGDDNAGGDDTTTDSGTGADGTLADTGPQDAGVAETGPFCSTTPCITSLGVGASFTCAVDATGALRCWGGDSSGQLGVGDPDGAAPAALPPALVPGITGAVGVGAGGLYSQDQIGFTCAQLASGGVSCMGLNIAGELGRGPAADGGLAFTPTPAPALATDVKALAAGYATTCVIHTAGNLDCWGYGGYFQLGSPYDGGLGSPTPIAVPVPAGTTFTQVSIGAQNACAVSSDKHVWCWGMTAGGQLGLPTLDAGVADVAPGEVVGISDAVEVAAGYEGGCALLSSGVVECWGIDAPFGVLGRGAVDSGSFDPVAASIAMPTGVTFQQIVAHIAGFCALDTTGAVWCWGLNQFGSNGVGTLDGSVVPATMHEPTKIDGLTDVIRIDGNASGGHVCAIVNGGAVKCWGLNLNSQLGYDTPDGSPPISIAPVDVHF